MVFRMLVKHPARESEIRPTSLVKPGKGTLPIPKLDKLCLSYLSQEKHVFTTINKDLDFVKKLQKDYESKGFTVRFEDIRHLDHS